MRSEQSKPVRRRNGPDQSLAGLGLSFEHLQSLARQGSVCEERRGSLSYYKLRFRHRGQQLVRYLGRDPAVAERIRKEVTSLQEPRQATLELSRLRRQVRQALRDAKMQLTPVMAQRGLKYHGYSLRASRQASAGVRRSSMRQAIA